MSKKTTVLLIAATVAVVFIGILVADSLDSLMSPSSKVLAGDSSSRITGVTQYYAIKDGSLYKVRFSLTDAENAFAASDAHVKFVVIDDNTYEYDTMMPIYKSQRSDAADRVASAKEDLNRAFVEYGPESEYVSEAARWVKAAEKDAAAIDQQIKALEEAGRQRILYTEEFDVRAPDFREYEIIMTGNKIFAYMWQIDASEFETDDTGLTKAQIWVTLPNGKTFSAETILL
ncbi:hypothetical protein [Nitrososphaera sp.]|uniref:hypothetical protein n=1 Tax=Nitrososphaera sp. TaxID=1971748 RepID=UPI00307E5DCD